MSTSTSGKREQAMNQIPAVVAAIAALVGVVIGSLLNHYFEIRIIKPTAQIQETTDAYVDFINGVAALKQVQRVGDDSSTHLAKIASAKARIAMYGHPSVIAAIAEFERQGSQITAHTFDAFSSIVLEMRRDVSKDKSRSHQMEDDIKILLFGVDDR